MSDPLDPTSIYIKRYMLWFTKRVCINVIYKEQDYPHSHPWDYMTIILWGGYRETIYDEDGTETTFTRKPFYIGRSKYTTFHRLYPLKTPVITLFFRSKVIDKFLKFIIDGKVISGARHWGKMGVDIRKFYDGFIK